MEFLPSDWARVFAPETPLLELVARGAALYFGILILMRHMLRRSVGDLAGMDLIFIILVAEAAAHALGDYTSVADGIVLILVFMGSNYLVNLLSYHVPLIERLTSNPPVQVVKDGQLLRRNMRREFLTEQELMEHLRQEGIEEIGDVKEAYIEENGKLTAVSRKDSKYGEMKESCLIRKRTFRPHDKHKRVFIQFLCMFPRTPVYSMSFAGEIA